MIHYSKTEVKRCLIMHERNASYTSHMFYLKVKWMRFLVLTCTYQDEVPPYDDVTMCDICCCRSISHRLPFSAHINHVIIIIVIIISFSAHINHVREVAGIDSVGIGASYDGINE